MTKTLFSELNLTPDMQRAVERMGFEAATPIQSQAIPVIRTGVDVIARSRTGTGKTVAFAIPAIERVDTEQEKSGVQVLVLCPTRELAMQANEEICRLSRFNENIRSVAVYGGARIDKQCIALRKANVVVGTPGRIMDHMRRKSIKLNRLKMVVLDEADEMLNMGFKEDIETILTDTPESRQTVFFSATMPPAIMKITKEFQKSPQLIEADRQHNEQENRILQQYIAVPHARKKDALALLLRYYRPTRAIVFCATKKMADEITELLGQQNIAAESIHSDIKQDQRTATMRNFKGGKTTVLVATDIAARGIDVNDVEYVINYDLPPNKEHYIHRIGRTGRAGKEGTSVTICSSRREAADLHRMASGAAKEMPIPTAKDIQKKASLDITLALEAVMDTGTHMLFNEVIRDLREKGYSAESIAEAALSLHYQGQISPVAEVFSLPEQREPKQRRNGSYCPIILDVGRKNRITVNHLVGAITEHAGITGREVGRIDIADEYSVVEVAQARLDEVMSAMQGCKICGKTVYGTLASGKGHQRRAQKNGVRRKASKSNHSGIEKRRSGQHKR